MSSFKFIEKSARDDLVKRYLSGDSIQLLSRSTKLSTIVIRRVLKEEGCEIRTKEQAQRLTIEQYGMNKEPTGLRLLYKNTKTSAHGL